MSQNLLYNPPTTQTNHTTSICTIISSICPHQTSSYSWPSSSYLDHFRHALLFIPYCLKEES